MSAKDVKFGDSARSKMIAEIEPTCSIALKSSLKMLKVKRLQLLL